MAAHQNMHCDDSAKCYFTFSYNNMTVKLTRKTWDYYLCLCCIVLPIRYTCIVSLWHLTRFCRAIVYLTPVVLVLLTANQMHLCGDVLSPWTACPWMLYCVSETAFTLYYVYTKSQLSRRTIEPPQLVPSHASRHHRPLSTPEFFLNMIKHTSNVRKFVEEWFYDTSLDEISRPSLRQWLAYLIYSKETSDLQQFEVQEIDSMIDHLYVVANVKEPKAHSTKPIPCIRHTLDDFQSVARPWLVYAMAALVDYITAGFFILAGFRHYTIRRGLHYWHRGAMTGPVTEPLVFIHGIGVGLVLYLPLLSFMLSTHQNRPIFLVELPFVSMKLCQDVPTKEETIVGLRKMLRTHGVGSAHWMGHSLGTVVCSWVSQELPHMVSHVTFIDPIVFYLWKRDVAYNFLYRDPRNGLEVLMWYFASTEVHIVHVMRRHFWWYNNVCFPEHLPRHPESNQVAATIFLSSHDLIINAQAVYAHLLRAMKNEKDSGVPMIETVWWDGFTHGEMLLHLHSLLSVTSNVKCREGYGGTSRHVAKWNWKDYVMNRLFYVRGL